MRFVDEYRAAGDVRAYAGLIARAVTRPWTLMEICGGQTHTFIKSGVDRMLPESLTLVHGPGCPVCVTPLEQIDRALAVAARPGVLFTSFGDMLRVPGSSTDLLSVKARGGDVRMVYSPLDAVRLAQRHPDREVVFFAVGFETTAPATAMAVWQAAKKARWGRPRAPCASRKRRISSLAATGVAWPCGLAKKRYVSPFCATKRAWATRCSRE